MYARGFKTSELIPSAVDAVPIDFCSAEGNIWQGEDQISILLLMRCMKLVMTPFATPDIKIKKGLSENPKIPFKPVSRARLELATT